MKLIFWQGEKNRELKVQRPCECGCDRRDGYHGVGYLTGSDEKGNGFSLWMPNEAAYRSAKKMADAINAGGVR